MVDITVIRGLYKYIRNKKVTNEGIYYIARKYKFGKKIGKHWEFDEKKFRDYLLNDDNRPGGKFKLKLEE